MPREQHFFPPYFTLASLRDPVFPLIFFRHSAQLSECGPQEWAPKLQNTSPIVWEKHCRRAKKKKELNFVSLFPCVYLCVYLLGALYALPPCLCFTRQSGLGFFSLCFFCFFYSCWNAQPVLCGKDVQDGSWCWPNVIWSEKIDTLVLRIGKLLPASWQPHKSLQRCSKLASIYLYVYAKYNTQM